MFWYKKHKGETMTLELFWGFLWRLVLLSTALIWPFIWAATWCIDKYTEYKTKIEGYLAGQRARKAEEENEKEDFAD